MSISTRWIWTAAIGWTVLDIVTLAVGWGEGPQTVSGIMRILMFTASLHIIAYINQPVDLKE